MTGWQWHEFVITNLAPLAVLVTWVAAMLSFPVRACWHLLLRFANRREGRGLHRGRRAGRA